MAKLTPKQKAFADEYLTNGGNATQAAIKAGYSKKTARNIGAENITKPNISSYIASKLKPIENERNIGVDEALTTLASIWLGEEVKSTSRHINNLNGDIEKDMTYEFTPDLESKLKAIDLYLKYKSLIDSSKEQTVPIVITDSWSDDDG